MYVAFLVEVVYSATLLPDQVASHFGFEGQPDGWMSRSATLLFMAVFGIVFPLLLPALFYGIRHLPDSAINLPDRDYWLAPERREETYAYLFRHALWLACLQVGFAMVLHALVVDANLQTPPRLSGGIWVAGGLFLAGVIAWIWSLVRHFRRSDASSGLSSNMTKPA
jgi:serine/threonine-protein kinase